MKIEGKYNLELNFPGDGRVFLNFWDHVHGEDVVAELMDGKLIASGSGREISFDQFVESVQESIQKREQ